MRVLSLMAVLSSGTLVGTAAVSAGAQQMSATSVDVAITFTAQRSLQVATTQNFWAEGGSIEWGANAFRGFGLGASVAGVHTASVGSTGTPLSLVTETFGPRYRWHDGHRLSLYGEGLLGEANAFNSLFPATAGAQPEANSLAIRVGGGLDVRLGRHFAVRALDASWLRTQFPNSTGNVQNNLLLKAGLVFRASHGAK